GAAHKRRGFDRGPSQSAGVCHRDGQRFGSGCDDGGDRSHRCRGVLSPDPTGFGKVLATNVGSQRPLTLRRRKTLVLSRVAVELAGLRRFLLAPRRHFRGVFAARYAARAELLAREIVLGRPVVFVDLTWHGFAPSRFYCAAVTVIAARRLRCSSLKWASNPASATCMAKSARQLESSRASIASSRASGSAGADFGQCASRSLAALTKACLTSASASRWLASSSTPWSICTIGSSMAPGGVRHDAVADVPGECSATNAARWPASSDSSNCCSGGRI